MEELFSEQIFFNLNLEIINPQTFVRRNLKGLLKAIEGKGRDTLETVLYENTWKLAILSHKKLEENVVRFFARASIHFPLWKANHSFFFSFFFSFFLASYVIRKNERNRVSRLPRFSNFTSNLIHFCCVHSLNFLNCREEISLMKMYFCNIKIFEIFFFIEKDII